MADEMAIICFFCRRAVPGSIKGLSRHVNWHTQNKELSPDFSHYDCTFARCKMRYQNFSSLKRHIKECHHVDKSPGICSVPIEAESSDDVFPESNSIEDSSRRTATQLTLEEIRRTACLSICRLRADTSLPQKKITEAINICDNIITQLLEFVVAQTESFLKSNQIDVCSEIVQSHLNIFKNLDLFSEVKTCAKQTSYLEKLAVQIPEPVDKCVGRRVAVHHVNGVPRPVYVNETFTYLPIIESLKLIFRDPHNRQLLQMNNFHETPGVKEYSSYETGLLYDK